MQDIDSYFIFCEYVNLSDKNIFYEYLLHSLKSSILSNTLLAEFVTEAVFHGFNQIVNLVLHVYLH